MPPKAEAGAGSDAFLVACIKCSKAKLEVDFDAVAKATGLSKGGANNKFRAIMKQLENEGAMWASTGAGNGIIGENGSPKRKAAPKKAVAKPEDESDSVEEGMPAMKKANAKAAPKKKGTATAKEKKTVAGTMASEGEAKDDEQTAVASEGEA